MQTESRPTRLFTTFFPVAVPVFFTVLLFCLGEAYAQPSRSADVLNLYENRFILGLNPSNGNFLVFLPEKYYELVPSRGWQEVRYKQNDMDSSLFYPQMAIYVPAGSRTFYIRHGGGPVYEFRDSSLVRIDSSHPHNNQFGSAMFHFENNLYMYGGYGYFSHKKYMTRLPLNNPEWFVFGYAEGSKVPSPRNNVVFHIPKDEQKLYVAGGNGNTQPEIEGSTNTYLDDVWALDMQSKRWKKMGTLLPKNRASLNPPFLSIGNQLFVFESGQSKSTTLVDFPNNRVKSFLPKVHTRADFRYHPIYSPQHAQVMFALGIQPTSGNPGYRITPIPFEGLTENLTYSRRLYYPEYWYTLGAVLLCLVVGGTALMVYIKKRPKRPSYAEADSSYSGLELHVGKKTLSFMNRVIPLTQEHIELILFFQENEWELSNNRLLEKVRLGQESQEVLKKRKARLIDEINQQFTFTTQFTEPLVLESKDINDRRFKEFRINPTYVEMIRVTGAK